MSNYLKVLILTLSLIFVVACNSQNSNMEFFQKICSGPSENTIFVCETNDRNATYFSTNTDPNIVDGGAYYYDRNGIMLINCGFTKPYPEDCSKFNEIKCTDPVFGCVK